jgi:UDP-N-acetylglucosamine 2-epimerase
MREPLSYKENLRMISGARRVLTDSGGVQNEAYWMRRPCAVLRRETEWKGGRADGWSVLTDADAINIRQFLQMPFALNKHQRHMPEVGAKRLLRDFLLNL